MAKRNVLKAFKLNTPDGIIDFAVGTQKIDDKYIDHWFVQAHLEQPEDEAEEEPEEEQPEDEAAERERLHAELASFGINVGGNIKLDTLRARVAKARADAENPAE
ncbi:STY1053 family phage-associated protein [Pseudomonas nitroreducens]|uniref:STY1053 family phage-associated protein n=1 Tax=Pseudomonas nitroreducens TaxID=46680 RepID=UPI003CC8127F